MRATLLLLLLLLLTIACQSAEHRELSSRIGDHKGTRVVSNVLEAPPEATWKWARIQSHAYRSETKAQAFVKEWAVWTDLLVAYAGDKYAGTRLKTLEEGSASADELVEQARRTYQLRVTGPEMLEFSSDGATWLPLPVPVPRSAEPPQL